MSFSKNTLLLSFAFIGFLVGSVAYFAVEWLIINWGAWILYIPFPSFGPGFMSGIAGSILSVIAVLIAAHFSAEK